GLFLRHRETTVRGVVDSVRSHSSIWSEGLKGNGPTGGDREIMAKRMFVMLIVTALFVGALGFVKFKQIQTAVGQAASFQPPPEAVTTIAAVQEQWPATLTAIGSVAAVQGVTVSADLPGTVDRIGFEAGRSVREGEVLA